MTRDELSENARSYVDAAHRCSEWQLDRLWELLTVAEQREVSAYLYTMTYDRRPSP